MEVFHQRLETEHGASIIATPPTVPYNLEYIFDRVQNYPRLSLCVVSQIDSSDMRRFADGARLAIHNASQWPLGRKVVTINEPIVEAAIVTPSEFVGGIMELCADRRGSLTEHNVLGPTRTLLRYCLRPRSTTLLKCKQWLRPQTPLALRSPPEARFRLNNVLKKSGKTIFGPDHIY